MKKIFLTITLLISLFIPVSNAIAQEEAEETVSISSSPFELELIPGIQSIFDKSIPITLNITSNVDTEKMQLRWELPQGMKSKGSYTTDWGSISKGQQVTTNITLKPEEPGTYNVVVEVQDWETNNVETKAIELTFDNNLELSPQSDEYYRNQRSWFWAKIGIGIVILIITLILGYFGIKAFQKWMDED